MNRQWWDIRISFEAEDDAEADRIWDAITDAACGGGGDPHECKRQVASSLRPLDDEGEEGPLRQLRGRLNGQRYWNSGDGTTVTLSGSSWNYSWPAASSGETAE